MKMKTSVPSRKKTDALTRKFTEGASYQKMSTYILSLINDPLFQNKISSLREKYQLPPQGIAKSDIQYFNTFDRGRKTKTRLPPIEDERLWVSFVNEVLEFCEKDYGLYPNWSSHTVRDYILYNIIEMPDAIHGLQCKLMDMSTFFEQDIDMSLEDKFRRIKYISSQYPVVLFISPYANEREIVDYIKRTYKPWVEPAQGKRRESHIKIGRVRKRNKDKQKRNAFIYQHRNKPIGELVRLVGVKFGKTYDYTYIQKIIALELKKRGSHRK